MWDSLGVLGLRAGSAVLRGRGRIRARILAVRRIARPLSDVPPDEPVEPLRVPAGDDRPPLPAAIARLAAVVVAAALVLSALVLVVGTAVARAIADLVS